MTTTRPTHASRSRWAAPASFAVLGALGATILGACTPNTGLDMSKPLSDGTWTAQSNPDDQGSIGTITITVEGNQDYYKKAQAAVASYQEYSENLTKVGDPAKVDVITGATVAHQQFVQAAIRAIAAAQGVSPDGADDIEIPGLNDATKDAETGDSDG